MRYTIATGPIDTNATPVVLRVPESGRLDVGHMITHRFALDSGAEACQASADPAHIGALNAS